MEGFTGSSEVYPMAPGCFHWSVSGDTAQQRLCEKACSGLDLER
jgi:hypothetical protein